MSCHFITVLQLLYLCSSASIFLTGSLPGRGFAGFRMKFLRYVAGER